MPLYKNRTLLVFGPHHPPSHIFYHGTQKQLVQMACYDHRGFNLLEPRREELSQLSQILQDHGFSNKILLALRYFNGQFRWHESGDIAQLMYVEPQPEGFYETFKRKQGTMYTGLTIHQDSFELELLPQKVDYHHFFQPVCTGISPEGRYTTGIKTVNDIKSFRQKFDPVKVMGRLDQIKSFVNNSELHECEPFPISLIEPGGLKTRFDNYTFKLPDTTWSQAKVEANQWGRLKNAIIKIKTKSKEVKKIAEVLRRVQQNVCKQPLSIYQKLIKGETCTLIIFLLIIVLSIAIGILIFVLYQINKSCCHNFMEVAYPSSLRQQNVKSCCCLYPHYPSIHEPDTQVAVVSTEDAGHDVQPRIVNNYLLATNPIPRALGPREEIELRRLFNNVVNNSGPNMEPINDERLMIQNA